MVYEGVSGNACLLVVCLRESSVDYHQLPVGLDGLLAVGHMDRDVTVYYMPVRPLEAE